MKALLNDMSSSRLPSNNCWPRPTPPPPAGRAGERPTTCLDDRELVRRAYRFADTAHLGQMRHSGEPQPGITHPIAAAWRAEWKARADGRLLHDAMEDCGVTKADLVEQFGPWWPTWSTG